MVRIRNLTIQILALAALGVRTADGQQFEVTSVKPTPQGRQGLHQLDCSSGTGFTARDTTLRTLVEWAYDLPHDEVHVSGGPAWMNSPGTTFDVRGTVARKVTFAECRVMVRSLLADRFQLSLHRETRDLPVFLLSVGKQGSKLQPASDDPTRLSRVKINGGEIQMRNGFATTGTGRGMSLQELARYLSALPMVGRPVLDQTGLAGLYAFSLDFALSASDETRPDLFTAVQEQLGLRLEAAKRPVGILVIDRAGKPSEN